MRKARATEGAKLRALRETELKKRDATRLRELSGRIRRARTARRDALKHIRELCRWGRQNVRARVAQLRAETAALLRDQVAKLRTAERDACARDKSSARAELSKRLDEARLELEQARQSFKTHYGRKASRSSAAERRQESTDEVARNLPPELVAVWRKVEHAIRPGPRRTRTEAFLEWAEENPDTVHSILYEQADRDVERLIAEQRAIEARLAKARRGARYTEEDVAAALGAVPF